MEYNTWLEETPLKKGVILQTEEVEFINDIFFLHFMIAQSNGLQRRKCQTVGTPPPPRRLCSCCWGFFWSILPPESFWPDPGNLSLQLQVVYPPGLPQCD